MSFIEGGGGGGGGLVGATHIVSNAMLKLLNRYNFGRCSFELAETVSFPLYLPDETILCFWKALYVINGYSKLFSVRALILVMSLINNC